MDEDIVFPRAYHDFSKTNGAEPPVQDPGGPSMTRQEFAAECDINTIMQNYDAYLSDPMRSVREPLYYDFTQLPDTLIDAMEVLERGKQAFYSLPATVRREFDNNPAAFVDFASDPQNVEQMRNWGLARPVPVASAPEKSPVSNDPDPVVGTLPT